MNSTTESAQILAALTQQNELLAKILSSLNRPHLGLSNQLPGPLKIYANRSNGGLWYSVRDGVVQPIEAIALTGYLRNLSFEEVERRGKPTHKLLTEIQGDRLYVIESGYDSHFSKGLLAAVATLTAAQLQQPITLQPQAGQDESVLFCRVYGTDGAPIKATYNDETDWRSISKSAIKSVRQVSGDLSF